MQLESPNLTQTRSPISPGNPFIWGSKVKVMSHKNITGVGLCTLLSAGFFLLKCRCHEETVLWSQLCGVRDADWSTTVMLLLWARLSSQTNDDKKLMLLYCTCVLFHLCTQMCTVWRNQQVSPAHSDCEARYDMLALLPSQRLPSARPEHRQRLTISK